jgi:hypothetical protein
MNCRRTMNAGLKSPLTNAKGFSPWRVLRLLRAEANPNKQYKAPPITKDERRAAWCHLHSSWPQQSDDLGRQVTLARRLVLLRGMRLVWASGARGDFGWAGCRVASSRGLLLVPCPAAYSSRAWPDMDIPSVSG